MRIDKRLGAIYLNKTDSVRWNTSPAFRADVLELAMDMLGKQEQRLPGSDTIYASVDVFSKTMIGLVSLEIRRFEPRTKKSPIPQG